jgi:hypothetical protein
MAQRDAEPLSRVALIQVKPMRCKEEMKFQDQVSRYFKAAGSTIMMDG